eukprot:3386482-Pleurochrysis_carterae.AAC.1
MSSQGFREFILLERLADPQARHGGTAGACSEKRKGHTRRGYARGVVRSCFGDSAKAGMRGRARV